MDQHDHDTDGDRGQADFHENVFDNLPSNSGGGNAGSVRVRVRVRVKIIVVRGNLHVMKRLKFVGQLNDKSL